MVRAPLPLPAACLSVFFYLLYLLVDGMMDDTNLGAITTIDEDNAPTRPSF